MIISAYFLHLAETHPKMPVHIRFTLSSKVITNGPKATENGAKGVIRAGRRAGHGRSCRRWDGNQPAAALSGQDAWRSGALPRMLEGDVRAHRLRHMQHQIYRAAGALHARITDAGGFLNQVDCYVIPDF